MRLIRKTAAVTRQVLARKKYRRICAVIAVLYLLAFLLAVQNLSIPGGETAVRGGNLSAMFQHTGFLLFDAVAIVRTPAFTLIVSPVAPAAPRLSFSSWESRPPQRSSPQASG